MTNFVPELGLLVVASDRTVPNLTQLVADAGLTGKIALAKDVGFPHFANLSYYKDFAPRIGFAWRPLGGTRIGGSRRLRIFYGNNLWNPVRNDLANVYPFSVAQTLE